MKFYLSSLFALIFLLSACKQEKKEINSNQKMIVETVYDSFGAKISAHKFMDSNDLLAKFTTLNVGDTIPVKFTSVIDEVCSKKGCWMKLPLDDKTETMVRFKDYGFFMPLDAKGKEVIVKGKAFVKKTSVEELQHYAEDAGKSKEEIAKITTPKIAFSVIADGVLLKK